MSPNVGFAKLPIESLYNGNFANPKRKRDKRKDRIS